MGLSNFIWAIGKVKENKKTLEDFDMCCFSTDGVPGLGQDPTGERNEWGW